MLPESQPKLIEQLNSGIEKHQLTHLREELLAAAKPCIVLFEESPNLTLGEMEERLDTNLSFPDAWEKYLSDNLPIGGSRLGGPPDLPDCIAWPTIEGGKLPFIAQVELASLPDYEGKLLPDSGWLYLFAGGDGYPFDSVVIHHNGPREQLKRAEVLEVDETLLDWTDDGPYYGLVPIERAEISISIAIDDELPPFGELPDEVKYQIEELTSSLVLIDHDSAAAQLCGNGNFYDVTPSDVATIGGPEGDWELLMEIHSVGSMLWADAGFLMVFLRRSDLIRRDFSSPYTVIYSS